MKRILVINNDFDTMNLLKAWLEIKGYEAEFTGQQEKLAELIEEFKPHLVLIDEMQNEIVEKLKSDNNTRTIPVLLMTGYTSRQAAAKLPADDIIEKPFVLPLLEKKIQRLIDNTPGVLTSHAYLSKL